VKNEGMKKASTKTSRSRLDTATWSLLLEAREESDLSVKDFCASQGISEASFYLWRKRLGKDKETAVVVFSPIEIQAKSGGHIEVELPGGVVLRFGDLPPVEYLRSLSSMYNGV
jgi:hypothetical protein